MLAFAADPDRSLHSDRAVDGNHPKVQLEVGSGAASVRALFVRASRLLEQLAIARASADYNATLARITKIDVLVLDDFLLAPLTDVERRDLLEVLEDRYGKTSTVITSQLPTKS